MSEITVENIGAIKHASIPIPEDGGVVELLGSNGCGKSTALKAVTSLLTGEGSLPLRDGTLEGRVEGLGIQINVKKSTRRKGELEVISIDSEFEIGALIDPRIADPVVADAKRMRELVRLTAGQADGSIFKELLGATEFDQFVPAEALEGGDILEKANRVKRALEKAAREQEGESDKAAGQAKAFRQFAEGVDLEAESNQDVLRQRLEEAISHQARLSQQKETADRTKARVAQSQKERERLVANYTGYSVETAEANLQVATSDRRSAEAVVKDLEDRIRELRKQLDAANDALSSAHTKMRDRISELQAAQQFESSLKTLDAAISRQLPESPTDEDLKAAEAAVQQARDAVENGAVVRQARDSLLRADQHDTRAKIFAETAKRLRAAAQGTEAKLTEMLPAECPLRFRNGRFILDTDRGETYLADLSDGERAKIAIDLVIPFMPEHSVLTIDQRIWQDLSRRNQIEVAKHCKKRRVRVLTARCTDDPELNAQVVEVTHGGETAEADVQIAEVSPEAVG